MLEEPLVQQHSWYPELMESRMPSFIALYMDALQN